MQTDHRETSFVSDISFNPWRVDFADCFEEEASSDSHGSWLKIICEGDGYTKDREC